MQSDSERLLQEVHDTGDMAYSVKDITRHMAKPTFGSERNIRSILERRNEVRVDFREKAHACMYIRADRCCLWIGHEELGQTWSVRSPGAVTACGVGQSPTGTLGAEHAGAEEYEDETGPSRRVDNASRKLKLE